MSERPSPYLVYSPDRLAEAAQDVQARLTLAEHNLQRALARQQQAEAATARVRRLLERAQGDQRLIQALLKEKEKSSAEKEGAPVLRDKEETGQCVSTMLRPEPAPLAAPEAPLAALAWLLPLLLLYQEGLE